MAFELPARRRCFSLFHYFRHHDADNMNILSLASQHHYFSSRLACVMKYCRALLGTYMSVYPLARVLYTQAFVSAGAITRERHEMISHDVLGMP